MRLKRSLVKVVDNQWDQNLAPDFKILNQSKKNIFRPRGKTLSGESISGLSSGKKQFCNLRGKKN
jgi:hypothetical protein